MPSLAGVLAASLVFLLSGCNMDVLNPKGSVGVAEMQLIATSTWVMLIVVIPVIVLSLFFAWRYRSTNKSADYQPNWAHSVPIEIVVWTVPTLIIIFLGWLTWVSTHELDPYKPLDSKVKPIEVDVISLDWKWLFVYPELGIASVNQLAIPVGTPVNFKITSDAVMNSFFIPQLGSQIYAMAGMTTKLHLIADHAGDYAGLSANFSGPGFSDMKFRALALSANDFDGWVAKVKADPHELDAATYKQLTVQSENTPVSYYSKVDGDVFGTVVAKYMGGPLKNESSAEGKSMDMGGKSMNGMDMGGKSMGGMSMPAAASAPRG
jgi:cytochrome o ubiquinol oxidase subunit 2